MKDLDFIVGDVKNPAGSAAFYWEIKGGGVPIVYVPGKAAILTKYSLGITDIDIKESKGDVLGVRIPTIHPCITSEGVFAIPHRESMESIVADVEGKLGKKLDFIYGGEVNDLKESRKMFEEARIDYAARFINHVQKVFDSEKNIKDRVDLLYRLNRIFDDPRSADGLKRTVSERIENVLSTFPIEYGALGFKGLLLIPEPKGRALRKLHLKKFRHISNEQYESIGEVIRLIREVSSRS